MYIVIKYKHTNKEMEIDLTSKCFQATAVYMYD